MQTFDFLEQIPDTDPADTARLIAELERSVTAHGPERAKLLMMRLMARARDLGVDLPTLATTPYINTIKTSDEPTFPGDEAMETRIRHIVRWNAAAMVLRANKEHPGIGGHLATYASAASLYEVGFNHFFRGKQGGAGDQIFYQGHAAPGIYSRAYLEGRISAPQLDRFRQETAGPGGLPSYPHPRLLPDFWEFPTVSMGLGGIGSIYQARYNRYLHNRGLADTSNSRVWAFLGDGEMDEPESAGALTLAAREGLDNLTRVVNCNLQRLDGPVRGNGKIIQELEGLFRGAGWNVIKVIWAREWDDLLAKDDGGELVRKMDATVDGEFQKYTVAGGAYIREHFFGPEPLLQKLVEHLSDEDLVKLRRGGHDYRKIHAAYSAAVAHKGAPTVILAKTVKGWTLGPSVEATNPAHQAKKLSEVELLAFRDRLGLPIPDAKIPEAPYYHPGPKSPEVAYITERRAALGGPLPSRVVHPVTWTPPLAAVDEEFAAGSAAPVSTTMAFAKLLRNLMRDPALGKLIVPIVPDEARTFGMDPLFKQAGIYAPFGQRYEPVDSELLLSYRESQSGQVLEEGITEAGSMASFQASGTAYATHAVGTIPFYVFYSMFGFQRVGDQIWQSGDARVRGFLIGATAGRTTLAGEGLQHDDGHSQLIAHAMPHVAAYDPSFAYEMAALVRKGIERMHERGEDIVYYLTIYNENQVQPQLPVGASVGEGIHRGLYKFAEADPASSGPRVRLFGSGAIMGEVLKARDLLRERFGVRAEIWSATSYSELRREALVVERWNRRHPEATPRKAWLQEQLGDDSAPIVAASDWMTAIPDLVAPWINVPYLVLGTDGFGLSDTREALRDFFSVDSTHIAAAAMVALARSGERTQRDAAAAIKELGIDPELQPVFVLDR